MEPLWFLLYCFWFQISEESPSETAHEDALRGQTRYPNTHLILDRFCHQWVTLTSLFSLSLQDHYPNPPRVQTLQHPNPEVPFLYVLITYVFHFYFENLRYKITSKLLRNILWLFGVFEQKQKPQRVKAIYNCSADNPDELTFSEGEVIVVEGEEDHEWWVSDSVASFPWGQPHTHYIECVLICHPCCVSVRSHRGRPDQERSVPRHLRSLHHRVTPLKTSLSLKDSKWSPGVLNHKLKHTTSCKKHRSSFLLLPGAPQ